METKTETQANSAAYMRSHRAAWKEAGFTPVQAMVHDSDKKRFAAYADLLKYEALLRQVQANDDDAIELAATRNTPKQPTYDMVETLRERLGKLVTDNAKQGSALIGAVRNYSKQFSAHRTIADNDELDDIAAAKAVIYGNLSVCAFKLASAYSEIAHQQTVNDAEASDV